VGWGGRRSVGGRVPWSCRRSVVVAGPVVVVGRSVFGVSAVVGSVGSGSVVFWLAAGRGGLSLGVVWLSGWSVAWVPGGLSSRRRVPGGGSVIPVRSGRTPAARGVLGRAAGKGTNRPEPKTTDRSRTGPVAHRCSEARPHCRERPQPRRSEVSPDTRAGPPHTQRDSSCGDTCPKKRSGPAKSIKSKGHRPTS
jgi:hypothetical protein